MNSWREILHDYEFIKWDFTRFDKFSSKWVQQAFDAKKYAFAADYIRLYALYNYGGIYLDMDVEVLKSYNPLLILPAMLCFEANGHTIEAATMGAEKGAAWVKNCLDYYEGKSFVNDDGSFNMKPIPQIMQDVLSQNYNIQDIICPADVVEGAIPILPPEYFSPRSYSTDELNLTENTYSIHQFSGSWLPWYVKAERTICNALGIRYRDYLNRHINQRKQRL